MIDVVGLEDRVRAWVSEASGVAAERVTWADDSGPRPPGEFLSVVLTLEPLKRPGDDWSTPDLHPLQLAPTPYTVDGGALVVPGHGLATGDGPVRATGAVAGDFWVIRSTADRINLAASFSDARAGAAAPLPSSGSGVLSAAAGATTADRPGVRRQVGDRVLQLVAEARGGTATGQGHPWVALDAVEASTDSPETWERLLPFGILDVDAVQRSRGSNTGVIRIEPYARLSMRLSAPSEVVERLAVIQRADVVAVTVI